MIMFVMGRKSRKKCFFSSKLNGPTTLVFVTYTFTIDACTKILATNIFVVCFIMILYSVNMYLEEIFSFGHSYSSKISIAIP